MSYTDTIEVNQQLEEVFAAVSNAENGPHFFDNVEKVEKLTDGPIQIGTKYQETKRIRSYKAEAILEVVDFVLNKQYKLKSEPNGLIVLNEYTFTSTEKGTKIEFKMKIQTKGIRNLLTKPIIVNILKKENENHLANIKKFVEA
ncbi:polyketide cyclase/dehydrase/lipid transport protein [Bacillus oleivorans]|uniref:Polyketide cyclase/dehydrase/lipid transport protein n=1 Tax=Bacillus oleivorans TaxID=1448271 RepID=A0A285CGY2_9BACI|nr:SRPBCC family protein [Bacillus oleivorans]SNX66851.1 polyketide cyclase/dehydrase/lipid transport protein [Bacillus oleivorans]